MICYNCGEADGAVRPNKRGGVLCPDCAALHIRTLGSVAEDRAKSWQAERIRAENLAAVCRELLAARIAAHDWLTDIERGGHHKDNPLPTQLRAAIAKGKETLPCIR
jgi:hypothetical protein